MVENGHILQHPDGTWSLPQTKTETRIERIRETLKHIGIPAHFKEIATTCKLLNPEMDITEQIIHNILSNNENIFARIGRGTYGLSEWGLHSDGSLANAVWRVINTRKHPMTLEEIQEEVQQTWQVENSSIQAAISMDSRFTKMQDGRIGLTQRGLTIKKIKKRSDNSRTERLREVLNSIGKPCDLTTITLKHNDLYPDMPLTEGGCILYTAP